MKLIHGFTYRELFGLAIQRPLMAQLEVTRNCNQSCMFCFRACRPQLRFPDKPLSAWVKAVKKMVAIGIRELNFSGGEVFLYQDLVELMQTAKRFGINKIVVNTNGLVDLRRQDLGAIDELVFSLHDLDAAHDQVTGTKGSFERAVRSLEHALGSVPRVGINTVVTEENITRLPVIYHRFAGLPLAYHAFNLAIDQQADAKKMERIRRLLPGYLSFLHSLPDDRRKLRHGLQNIFCRDPQLFKGAVPLPHCAAGKYKIVVDYLGDVYPCRYFQKPAYRCGNIFTDDLERVWKQGKGFKVFRDLITEKPLPTTCRTCLKRGRCRGGCLAWRPSDAINHTYDRDFRCAPGHAYLRG